MGCNADARSLLWCVCLRGDVVGRRAQGTEERRATIWLFFKSLEFSSYVDRSTVLCMYVDCTKCLGPPNQKSDRYLHDVINKGACPMYDADDAFNNPLKWWKENCAKYPYVAKIARKYLAIPATSAPSEQVWSRLAKFLSLWRAHLSDDLVGRMMFGKENLVFLHKHYRELMKKETVKELHHLVNLKFNYLIAMDEDDEDIDVGKNDHLLDF
jgi:hypothetical protein